MKRYSNAFNPTPNLKMENITSTRIYLTDLKNFKSVNEIYGSVFPPPAEEGLKGGSYPARETVQVSALPKGAHIEISVIAVR